MKNVAAHVRIACQILAVLAFAVICFESAFAVGWIDQFMQDADNTTTTTVPIVCYAQGPEVDRVYLYLDRQEKACVVPERTSMRCAYTFTCLEPHTEYTVTHRAWSAVWGFLDNVEQGGYAIWTRSSSTPAAPVITVTETTETSIRIEWADSATGALEYICEYGEGESGPLGFAYINKYLNYYKFALLTEDTVYRFRVRAYYPLCDDGLFMQDGWTAWSDIVSARTVKQVTAPVNLAVQRELTSATDITLTWENTDLRPGTQTFLKCEYSSDHDRGERLVEVTGKETHVDKGPYDNGYYPETFCAYRIYSQRNGIQKYLDDIVYETTRKISPPEFEREPIFFIHQEKKMIYLKWNNDTANKTNGAKTFLEITKDGYFYSTVEVTGQKEYFHENVAYNARYMYLLKVYYAGTEICASGYASCYTLVVLQLPLPQPITMLEDGTQRFKISWTPGINPKETTIELGVSYTTISGEIMEEKWTFNSQDKQETSPIPLRKNVLYKYVFTVKCPDAETVRSQEYEYIVKELFIPDINQLSAMFDKTGNTLDLMWMTGEASRNPDDTSLYIIYSCDGVSREVLINGQCQTALADILPDKMYALSFCARSQGCADLNGDVKVVMTNTAGTPPEAPSTGTAVLAGNGTDINLSWQTVQNAAAYFIYLCLNASTSEMLDKVVSGEASPGYTHKDTVPDTEHTFKVYTESPDGVISETGLEIKIKTPPASEYPPQVPSGGSAQGVSPNEISVTWPAVDRAIKYRLAQSFDGLSFGEPIEVTGHRYNFNGLSEGTRYFFRMNAVNDKGESSYCVPFSGVTTTGAIVLPAIPVNIKADALSSVSVRVSCGAADNANIYKFMAEKRLAGEEEPDIRIGQTDMPEYTFTSLEPGAAYSFTVRASNQYGDSPLSAEVVCSTMQDPSTCVPSLPTALEAAVVTRDSITVRCAPSAYAQQYKFSVGTDITCCDKSAVITGTSCVFTGLTAGTKYYFRVCASNSYGDSPYAVSSVFTKTMDLRTPLIMLDMDNDDRDDVAGTFGVCGVWIYLSGDMQWRRLSAEPAVYLNRAGADMAVEYSVLDDGNPGNDTMNGIWLRTGNGAWSCLTNVNSEGMTLGDINGDGINEVIGNFGERCGGLWSFYPATGQWHHMNLPPCGAMASSDLDNNRVMDLVIDFKEHGVWALMNDRFGTSAYIRLNEKPCERIECGDVEGGLGNEVVIDLGAEGLKMYSISESGGVYYKDEKVLSVSGEDCETFTLADIDGNDYKDVVAQFTGVSGVYRMSDVRNRAWEMYDSDLNGLSCGYILSGECNKTKKDEVLMDITGVGIYVKYDDVDWQCLAGGTNAT